MKSAEYISAANTAKLIRRALKKAFPDQKFYVNTDSYAGGASIDVNWMDGPTDKEVAKVVKAYAGKNADHWLMPDGTVEIARYWGDYGQSFDHRDKPPCPEARLVGFMANHVFTKKAYSPEHVERLGQFVAAETGWDMPTINTINWWVNGKKKPLQEAHFDVDFTKLAPGSRALPLGDYFNRRLRET